MLPLGPIARPPARRNNKIINIINKLNEIPGFRWLILAIACFLTPAASAEWSFMDSWKAHPDFQGAVPRKSDVIFSTRFKRDNALEVARAYGATRIEWVYSADPLYIKELRTVAPWFGGALSSTIPLKSDQGIARDIEGQPIVAPWMKSWGAKWITVADASTRAALTDLAMRYISAGASSIQIDDPTLQFGARWWGADFSDSSIRGFSDFLQRHPDRKLIADLGLDLDRPDLDYREFLAEKYGIRTAREYAARQKNLPTTALWYVYLKESVLSHFSEFRRIIDGVAGKRVPLSMNLWLVGPDARRDQFALIKHVDYAMVETKIDDYDLLTLMAATYRSLGIGFVPSILPRSKEENRIAIAGLYALGAQPLVPWDVYINQGPEKLPTRFFGMPEDYADLYRFVRTNAEVFEGYETLPVVGILAPVEKYDFSTTLALVRRLNRANVPFAMVPVRSKPVALPDAGRPAFLQLLVAVNPLTDFDPETLSALSRQGPKIIAAGDLSARELADLSPVISDTDTTADRIIFRGRTNGEQALAIHVLPRQRIRSDDKGCRHPVDLKADNFPPGIAAAASLRSPGESTPLSVTISEGRLRLEVPCEGWSVVHLHKGK